jgi:RNA polymerase sigma factor (TIGR02999 family)
LNTPPSGPVTRLLIEDAGASDLVDRLMPFVYDELRHLARNQLRREYGPATLRTTELVHEAYAKLVAGSRVPAESKAHFFGAAARAMRQVLVDRARARSAQKRPPSDGRVTLDGLQLADAAEAEAIDILALHTALEAFAEIDPRAAQVVELRYFGGLTVQETADVLVVTDRTVKRDWRAARLWLFRVLEE